jgi:hypothetical protein
MKWFLIPSYTYLGPVFMMSIRPCLKISQVADDVKLLSYRYNILHTGRVKLRHG